MSHLFQLIIIYLISFLPKNEAKFIELESLSSGNYFIVLDSGIFIYNNELKEKKSLRDFERNNKIGTSDIINIRKHIYNENIYIFCRINNYLYIYDEYNNKLTSFIMTYYVDQTLLNYKYYNIIPYNTNDNKLNIIISSIREEVKKEWCWESIRCKYYYYYNDYIDYNIKLNGDKISFNDRNKNKQSFEVSSTLLNEKNICYLMDSSNIVKCIYYDNIYFFPLQYNVLQNNFNKSSYHYYYDELIINKIASAKSNKNNYLICPLFVEEQYIYNNYYNFTTCQLCDKDNDYDKCSYINYLFEEGCSDLKAYYFNETDKYVLICKTYNEFILLIIDHNSKILISRKIFYMNCTNNSPYNDKYSLIYNKYNNTYDLITENNFTENPKCSFYPEETNDDSLIYNNTKNFTHMEAGNKEIKIENSHHFYGDAFSDLTNEIFLSDSDNKIKNTNEENTFINNIINVTDTTYIKEKKEEKEETTIEKEITNKIKEENEEIIVAKETTNKTKEEIINNIEDLMADKEIGKNYEIKGDDFKLIIKPTNSPPLPNTTHVEFDECEQILRKEYNISNTSIITFFQMELFNEDNKALYNQIKYTTYDEQLKELDLSLCKDVNTQIHYAIKDDSNLDLASVSNFKNMGVDILDINDDFFTNLCYAFSDENNDMVLEDRIKHIFQNYSLCEEGCSYNNLDITTRSISCDCKIQGNISTVTNPLVFDSGKESSILDSNIGVSKCYNLVFSMNNKSSNVGFIVFCLLILAYIIIIIIQIKRGIKPVTNFLQTEMIKYGYLDKEDPQFFENKNFKEIKHEISSKIDFKNFKLSLNNENNPVIKENTAKKTYKIKRKKKKKKKSNSKSINLKEMNTLDENNENNEEEIKDKITNNNLAMIKATSKKKNKIKKNDKDDNGVNEENNFGIIKLKINSDIKKYYPKDSNQSLHNYTFDEATKYDRRNIFRVFYIYLLSKQIIFRTFLQKSPLELFPLRLTLFIFMLSCDLALNALFYFNDNISKKYHYASNLFFFTFTNNITIIIYSTLISYFILTLLSKLSNSSNAIRNVFRKEEEKIKSNKNHTTKEETNRAIFYEVENILKKFKIKIIILLVIETTLILFFWYFVTAFCHVYSSTQTSWLFDSFLSILSRLMLELIFGFLFAKLYNVAVASGIETFYKILICIYDFS